MRPRVGIEKISAYPCAAYLDFRDLATARGEDPDHPTKLLWMDKRGVNPCWEDPITMAVNAAKDMLTEQDRRDIELLIVGTESSCDQGKPISTFVHRFLDLSTNCRNFETKHACYSGTCGAMMAAHWAFAGTSPGKKALVISTDQSRMNLGERYEYVMGASAVAVLISNQPDVVEYELSTNGYWTKEVGDTFRPTSREEAGNTDESLYCYLEGLDGAYEHFKRKNNFDYDAYFKQHVYHVPFSAMAFRGHRAIMKREYKRSRAELDRSCDQKVVPSLTYSRECGGIYSAATFIGLMGAILESDVGAGDRISIYSYGSGSGSELYSVQVSEHAKRVVAAANMRARLDSRQKLSVAEYEAIERERTSYVDVGTYVPPTDGISDLYERQYRGQRRLVLRGVEGHFRHYDWS